MGHPVVLHERLTGSENYVSLHELLSRSLDSSITPSECDKCVSIKSVKSTFLKPEKLLFKKSIFLESDNP